MGVKNSACMILIAEKWPQAGTTGGWWTTEPFGYAGLKPGVRFGGAGGISPFISTAAFGQVNCELPYMRHRLSSERGSGTQPVGRVSIGYADGHVALKRNDELVDSNTGLSLLDSLWSPKDPNINN
jgi:prepilin-type processing-associated H-X9-DG protein